jgi:ribosomal protein L11 methyltransferase
MLSLMDSGFIEVSFRSGSAGGADVDAGEILAMLPGGERLGCWEDAGAIRIYWPENQWTPDLRDEVKRILAVFGGDAHETGVTIRRIDDRDWNAVWAASLTPIVLGRKVRVRQSWHADEADFDGIDLIIDPKRAFGTGHHATTRLVVEWLEDTVRGGERVLDIGTGSGILAMTAIRFGARSAVAIDNDPVAVECAREYAGMNGFGAELEFRVASFETLETGEFDIIAANIDGRTLPRLCPYLQDLMTAGGVCCFSGLQQHDYEEIAGALSDAGLYVRNRVEREEWLALSIARGEQP